MFAGIARCKTPDDPFVPLVERARLPASLACGLRGSDELLGIGKAPFRALGPARGESMKTYLSKTSSNLLSTNVNLLHIPGVASFARLTGGEQMGTPWRTIASTWLVRMDTSTKRFH